MTLHKPRIHYNSAHFVGIVIGSPGRHWKALVKLRLAVVFPERSGTLQSSLAPGSPQTVKHHDTKKRRSSVRRSDWASPDLDETSRLRNCQAARKRLPERLQRGIPQAPGSWRRHRRTRSKSPCWPSPSR
ncbi:hypothetical protein MTO96_030400 [Rhipicephalus appendiculatus]